MKEQELVSGLLKLALNAGFGSIDGEGKGNFNEYSMIENEKLHIKIRGSLTEPLQAKSIEGIHDIFARIQKNKNLLKEIPMNVSMIKKNLIFPTIKVKMMQTVSEKKVLEIFDLKTSMENLYTLINDSNRLYDNCHLLRKDEKRLTQMKEMVDTNLSEFMDKWKYYIEMSKEELDEDFERQNGIYMTLRRMICDFKLASEQLFDAVNKVEETLKSNSILVAPSKCDFGDISLKQLIKEDDMLLCLKYNLDSSLTKYKISEMAAEIKAFMKEISYLMKSTKNIHWHVCDEKCEIPVNKNLFGLYRVADDENSNRDWLPTSPYLLDNEIFSSIDKALDFCSDRRTLWKIFKECDPKKFSGSIQKFVSSGIKNFYKKKGFSTGAVADLQSLSKKYGKDDFIRAFVKQSGIQDIDEVSQEIEIEFDNSAYFFRELETMRDRSDFNFLSSPSDADLMFEYVCGLRSIENKKKNEEEYQEKLANARTINVLFLGRTGIGKTTFINSLANYMLFPSLSEAITGETQVLIPCKINFLSADGTQQEVMIPEGNEYYNENLKIPGQSATENPKSHIIYSPDLDVKIRIIDTPGLADTRGYEQDRKNMQKIIGAVKELGELSSIVFLLKPNESRLEATFRYCLTELLNALPKGFAENICFCVTNARGSNYTMGETSVPLNQLLEELQIDDRVRLKPGTNVFAVDNEAFRYLIARTSIHFELLS